MHSNEWSETVLVCIAFFLLGVAFTWPLLLNFNSMIYGPLGDATDAIITVEILARNNFLATGNSISKDFGAPFGSDAKYQYFMPPVLYLMLPLSTAFGAIAAHNLVKFLSLPIAAIAMYFLSKRFLKRKSSSFIAGFLFAFYPLNFHSISATFTKSNIWVIPLFVFALIKFNERKSNKNALLLGLVTFTTAFFSYYHFFFAILFAGIFFCHKTLLEKKPGKKNRGIAKARPAKALSAALPFAVAFFSFAILFLAFIAPLILSAKEAAIDAEASVFSDKREALMRLVFSSAWPSYFVTPPAEHPVLGQFALPFIEEHMVGIGFGPTALYLSITALVLGAYALHKKRRDKTIDMLLFSAICVFILATGPFLRYIDLGGIPIAVAPLVIAIYFMYNEKKKWAYACIGVTIALVFLPMLYQFIPPLLGFGSAATGIDFSGFSLNEIIEHLGKYDFFPIPMPSLVTHAIVPYFRAYVNLGFWLMFFVSLLAAIGFEQLAAKLKKPRLQQLLFAAIFCIILFEFLNFPPSRTTSLAEIPPEYAWLKEQQGDFIVAEYPLGYNSLYSYYQLVHKKKLYNSAYTPEVLELQAHIWNINDANTAQMLAAIGVKYVIMHDETLYNRVPPNLLEHITAVGWYKGKRVDAVQRFLQNNPNGTAGLRKAASFEHASIFEVTAEPDKQAVEEIIGKPIPG